MTGRVLVTGATGNIGLALLRELNEAGAGPIAALTNDEARSRLPVACEARLCNYDDPAQIGAALDGVDAAFLMVPFDERMVEWGERFVAQASRRGVRFIVRVSALGAALDSGSAMGRLHGRIDDCAKRSGIPCTVLRCNAFMQNFSGHYRHMIRRGVLALPEGDARMAFIDTADIAAVAARALEDPAPHAGRTYDLDGPECLGNGQALEIISELTGAELRYQPISPAEARQTYENFGISSWRIDVLESLAGYIRGGNAERVTGTLGSFLGRRPGTFREFAERHRHCWEAR